jgi:hypothetical protein
MVDEDELRNCIVALESSLADEKARREAVVDAYEAQVLELIHLRGHVGDLARNGSVSTAPLVHFMRRAETAETKCVQLEAQGEDLRGQLAQMKVARDTVELERDQAHSWKDVTAMVTADQGLTKFEGGLLKWPGGGMNLDMLRALLARAGLSIVKHQDVTEEEE